MVLGGSCRFVVNMFIDERPKNVGQVDKIFGGTEQIYRKKYFSLFIMLSLGFRFFRRAAFPLTSAIESCWKRWRVTVISSSPVCRASALPSFLISLTADLCQAPRLSTACC